MYRAQERCHRKVCVALVMTIGFDRDHSRHNTELQIDLGILTNKTKYTAKTRISPQRTTTQSYLATRVHKNLIIIKSDRKSIILHVYG